MKKRDTVKLKVKRPDVFLPFTALSRYKVAYGGRGSAKSWTVATMFILKAIDKKIRILCCREIMESIKESVHKLLSDTIERLELSHLFIITEHTIRCKKTDSDFIFTDGRSYSTDCRQISK